MRLTGVAALACLAAAGCGGAEEAKRKPQGSGELTVTLPPTLPTQPAAQQDAPKAGFDAVAAIEPAVAPPEVPKAQPATKQPEPEPKEAPPQVVVALAPAAEPAAPGEAAAVEEANVSAPAVTATSAPEGRTAGASAWAGYLRKAGFPCRSIAAADRVDRPSGAGLQFYRVQCEGGGTYQATNKRGHLYFRRWRG
jgi:outer membrane biosynthesis protein TonB